MPRTSLRVWLLLAAVVGALVAARLGRALGPAGILLAIALVAVAAVLIVDLVQAAILRATGPEPRPATMKNVTPAEPALSPGAEPSPTSGSPRRPAVIVIDPADGPERLAAKLEALDTLRAEGIVSDDEYEAKRAQLIADF